MNPNTTQLMSAILQCVTQLSYVILTGYGIRQSFIYLSKRVDVLGVERLLNRRGPETPPPADLLDPTEESLSLGLRDK